MESLYVPPSFLLPKINLQRDLVLVKRNLPGECKTKSTDHRIP